MKTIEDIVKDIVGDDCKVQQDIVHRTFLVETVNPITADQIDEICMEVPAWVSLRSFKGNVIFFGSLRV